MAEPALRTYGQGRWHDAIGRDGAAGSGGVEEGELAILSQGSDELADQAGKARCGSRSRPRHDGSSIASAKRHRAPGQPFSGSPTHL